MAQATIALQTLQDTIRRAVERFPAERARIERAAALIAMGHVERISVDVWEVRSQTDADTTYTLTGGTWRDKAGECFCVDSQRHPEQSCKHAWSVDLVQVAEERQRRLNAKAALSDTEIARMNAWMRRYNIRAALTA